MFALPIAAIYVAVLLFLLVWDVVYRRIPNVVVLPATLLALGGSALAQSAGGSLPLALAGAAVGLLFFYGLYRLGRRLYGLPALGMGDVKLAMLIGAMVGLNRVLPTLAAGMLLAGLAALLWLRQRRTTTLPYGAFLSTAAIFTLLTTL